MLMFPRSRKDSRLLHPIIYRKMITRLRFALVLSLVSLLVLAPLGPGSASAQQSSSGAPGQVKKSYPTTESLADSSQAVGQSVRGREDSDLDRVFKKRELIKMNPGAAARRARETGKLAFATSDKTFDIDLVPNDLRSADYRAEEALDGGVVRRLEKGPVHTFKGNVRGMTGAQARFTIDENSVKGAVITRGEQFFIEPARQYSKTAAADEFVFYQASDVIETAPAECGTTLAEEVGAEVESIQSKQPVASALTAQEGTTSEVLAPMRVIELATDADFEYHNALGGSAQANSQIQSIINQVDGIYQVELGLTFSIVFQNVYATASDPYTKTEAGGSTGALSEFRNFWNANRADIARDLVHLWTGKDFTGSTIGIAYGGGVVCANPDSSYGISQRYPNSSGNPITAQTVALTAHEIGHNFGADHTNQVTEFVSADVEAACDNTIMEAAVGSGMNFCQYSRSQIEGYANGNGVCLAATGAAPPSYPSCGETPIGNGATVSGSLSGDDCRAPSRGINFYADRYSFSAPAGQEVSISYSASSGSLDPYIYLIGPDGTVVTQNDDGGGGSASRIPSGTGFFPLPLTGKYLIEVTSYDRGESGAYTLALNFSGCNLSVSPTSHSFAASGGSGSVNVTAEGGCLWSAGTASSSFSSWITINSGFNGSGNGAVSFSVSPNTNEAARTGALIVAGQRININQSGTGPDCALTPINPGQTINGTLETSDCRAPNRKASSPDDPPFFYADRYTFNVTAGQQAVITMSSGVVDSFLTLIGPNGVVILNDDDGGGRPNSRIAGGAGALPLLLSGTYIVEASTYDGNETGPYALALSLSSTPAASSGIGFSSGSYTVGEGSGRVEVTVVRGGDTSGEASVRYATVPDPAVVRCDVVAGQASERCDYVTSIGRLRFSAGQTSATIVIPIVDDAYAEGAETLQLGLGEVTGTSLGSVSTAVVTIQDNDTVAGTNPIETLPFFVRQQYLDFLAREPEAGGFEAWLGKLGQCPAGELDNRNYAQDCTRIDVSSAFFRSPEFQLKGYYVYRFYRVSLGARPAYTEFIRDTARVTGATAEELAANRAAFPAEWVARPGFKARYDSLSNAGFVDTLLATAGMTSSLAGRRTAWVAALDSGTTARSEVLRQVVESAEVDARYYTEAFVAMQYFGYLRRDPDEGGYAGWLAHLNATGNYREMVWGFLLSPEYELRFGPVQGF